MIQIKMKTLFKGESKTPKYIIGNMSKNIIEKRIIMEFLHELPIEELKKLINFQEIDYEKKELWDDCKNREMLMQLRDENVVKYTFELYLGSEMQCFW